MEFGILGPLEAAHGGALLSLGGPRHRRLLAALLLRAGTVVPSERLIMTLWGDDPPRSAKAMLHVRVCELRAALRPGRAQPDAGLLNRDGGYVLQLAGDRVDAAEFERLAAAGARDLAAGEYERARTLLIEALRLWRGPAIVEFADEPFARADAARLEELRLRALEARLEADLATARHADLIGELEGLVVEHPLRERFRAQLMLALYRAGRQAEAVRAYQSARALLADELGLDPSIDLQRLNTAILQRDPALQPARPTTTPARRRRSNLPAALTSFVGRRSEIEEILSLIRANRLVTLTGVGGAGKSRLALEVAGANQHEFPDGVWLVDLSTLGQAGLVMQTVAMVLGLREHPHRSIADVLVEHLAPTRTLIILDNAEHLVAEVAEAADRLLRSCPDVQILATSRERLGITGEVLQPVGGLQVPDPDAASDEIGRADSVRLLIERAAAVQPGFQLTDATAEPIAQMCRQLDGLPLAIELAAAGVNAYGVEQIAARLDDRFGLLTQGSRTAPPRHQTLRAVVEWSYGLLDERERRLFDRLAVFAGGFTLEAAEAVGGGDDWPVAAGLARLVDASLVATGGGAPMRYRMLETLRAYAWDRLAETGEIERIRDRHAAQVLSMVESAREALHGPQQPVWLDRLALEHGNIRAALEWSIDRRDAATAVRLAGSLYPLWDQRGHYREGRMWLASALELKAALPPLVRARALNSVAGLAVIQGDLAQAAAASEEAAELSRLAGDPAEGAHALQLLGLTAVYAGNLSRAVETLNASLHNAREAGDRWLEGFTLLFLATAALANADEAATARLCDECATVLEPVGDREGLAWVAVLRAAVAWRLGDRSDAAARLGEAVHGFRALGHLWGLSLAVFLAGQFASDRVDHETCAALLAASEAMRKSVGAALLPFMSEWLEAVRSATRQALGVEAFVHAWQSGASMNANTVIALAAAEIDRARSRTGRGGES